MFFGRDPIVLLIKLYFSYLFYVRVNSENKYLYPMNLSKKIGSKILFFALILPVFTWSQLYHSQGVEDLAQRYFGLGYFPASWQSSVFAEDIYATVQDHQDNQFRLLSNALRLNYNSAEKMLTQFKIEYPNFNAVNTIDLDIANYYFNNEKYRYALKWYDRVVENQIPKLALANFYFNKGYTLFSAQRFKQAQPYLEKVKDNKDYESDAHYYLGHIAYQLDDFDSAAGEFDRISNSNQNEDITYFQADMNFRLGRFEQAIQFGKKVLKNASAETTSEVSKIIGESYFNLNEFALALPYLETYKGKKGKWEATDYYQLGYAYYKNEDYENALSQFNKILNKKNTIAQSAYYYLADCYLKLDLKTSALNAFKRAAERDDDPLIQEDAFLNYAKLSFELGNPYQAPSQVLIDFLEAYPQHEQKELIGELLISSYTKSGNYQAAIQILDNKSGFKDKQTLERVLLLQAISDYNNANFSESSTLFKRILKIRENPFFEAYALYWLGRSEYEQNHFDDALTFFKDFIKHPNFKQVESHLRVDYDMGYVYFKLGEYASALEAFERFDKINSVLAVTLQRDTFLRLGDCSFVMKNYWPAMEYYNKAIALDESRGAYPSYQKALSYGFVDRNAKKIETLLYINKQFPKDPLIDDTLFELASAYSRAEEHEKALGIYGQLLENFERSPYLAQAALNKGLILYNSERYEEAKTILQEVALNYKRYAVGGQAVRTLREIAIDQDAVFEFTQWLERQELTTFTAAELEKTSFEAAEKRFLEGNFNAAERLLATYIKRFPEGAYAYTATYYLAELYYENKDFEKAQAAYETLAQGVLTNYTEKALVRLTGLLKNKDQKNNFIAYLEQLDTLASFKENRRYALLNLMQAYFIEGRYKKSLNYTERVLELPDLEPNLKWDAWYIKANSALAIKDSITAAETYRLIENNSPNTNHRAEALYFKSVQLFEEAAFAQSNNVIAKIAELGNSNGIWNVKSLILLAKNYNALEDPFQANFVLESVIDNFQEYPEEIEEAQRLLAQFNEPLNETANANK